MKLSKKLLYSAMAFTMLTSATVAPVAQIIPSSTVRAEVKSQPTRPETTTVNIYKLQADSYNIEIVNSNGIANKDGEALANYDNLGKNVKGLAGVQFKRYKIKDTSQLTDNELKQLTSLELADAKVQTGDLETGISLQQKTDQNGLVTETLDSKTNARYLYVEDVQNSPSNITKAYAVPFILSLPQANSTGTGFLTEINIYPKNVVTDEPKTDKDVKKLGQDDAGYAIGEKFNWFLKSTVPLNLEDYEQFEITDKLSNSLTFSKIGDIKIGEISLQANIDYLVTSPSAENGNTLKITFVKERLPEIAKLLVNSKLLKTQDDINQAHVNTNENAFLEIPVETSINEKTVLGKGIENTFTLQYDHTPDKVSNPRPSNPPKNPEVHTGGKRFVKVAAGNDATKLGGAEFDLLMENGDVVKWTEELIKANTNKNYIAGEAVVGQPVKLKSDADGSFEIKGLAYAIDAEATGAEVKYKLKETKAPAGYVIPEAPIEFTVNQTSYNKTPTTINQDAADADPQKVENNKRPEIPNTGGIGTAIFVVLGLIIMFVAARGMRRQKEDN
ncbi:SpaH/EbpB family LPXTG-anchored major pilin [Streptococcus dysgalactiae]|uniref:Isopeptide-forming domain-containing fimbrial protein n=1 Tax=Streptococcus dysgalactiae subsp. dysgalactiae TaxID=99822 RepID=A0A9X7SEJ0_STRDY|nr:SpaH/EbpB family LPXTG-anchored major pilin [Streptococcus dysgalactiae]MSU86732.1 isopeptide-forming domain-containing fimbrial protein [Streptococcus dysgalactiae subsp. dysgalactiae]QGG97874.1 isopeptide-forming domain-containing fimbrial protein [Streptococcus dysgalactiae subsp. dysgalactiae]QGH01191.1 isopeptide-forming domain-containing fimbrial protein [Streptococcus dysgalactiae subsp. dysgalactiae]